MILAWIVGISFISSVLSLAVYWTVKPPYLGTPPDLEPLGEGAVVATVVAAEFLFDL